MCFHVSSRLLNNSWPLAIFQANVQSGHSNLDQLGLLYGGLPSYGIEPTKFLVLFCTLVQHAHRRTKSESDARRLPPPEAKRPSIAKIASPELSPPTKKAPNDREPPKVCPSQSMASFPDHIVLKPGNEATSSIALLYVYGIKVSWCRGESNELLFF